MTAIATARDQGGASSPDEEDDGLLAGPRRPLTIGLVLLVTLVAFEALAVATVMPSAERELGGIALYGWAFSAFLLANLIGLTWAGEQCDAHGPARPLAVGLVLFASGLAVSGLAPEMWVLVLGRAIQGLGAGVVPAVAYVTIGRQYDGRVRPRMFAVLSSAWVVPGLVGPALAGSVADYLSWRLVFVGLLPLVAFAGALTLSALRSLPPPPPSSATARRVPRAVQLSAGAALMLAGLGAGTPFVAVPLLIAGALVALPALRALLPAGTLHAASGLPAVVAGNALVNMAFFGAEAFVPFTLTTIRGESSVVGGLALTSASITWATGSWIQARGAERWERRVFAGAGCALVAAGVAVVALVLQPGVPVAIVPVAWGIAGLGMGLAYPSFSLLTLASAAAGEEGKDSSALKLGEVLGAAIGAGIGGAIIAAGQAADLESGSAAAVFLLAAAVAVVGLLSSTRLPVLLRARAADAAA